ncbi:AfsR/SARP family transcriptional regulator [Nonomuraea sp. NPDC049725]|uniref:AfsR/SARP family transcriptional regulator n=1 Tax=Nonomuraea sp. NPDC049725 TaxID=3154508 RepID=UPI00344386C4
MAGLLTPARCDRSPDSRESVSFGVLGPLRVTVDSRTLDIPMRMQQILAVLLCHRDQPMGTARIADQIWGENPPKSAAKSVHVAIHHLRRALSHSDRIVSTATGYMVVVRPGELDADRFECLVERGMRAEEADRAAASLAEAAALWRGPALAGLESLPSLSAEAMRLEELRLAAIESRIDADLALARHAGLVAELKALVRRHPLRERLWGQLMIALYRSGRPAESLNAFTEARRVMLHELGMEPGAQLARLETAILARDPGLDVRPAVRSGRGPAGELKVRRLAPTAGRRSHRLTGRSDRGRPA